MTVIKNVLFLNSVNFKFGFEVVSNHVPLTIIIQSRLGERENFITIGTGGGGCCSGEIQENSEVQIEDKKFDFMSAFIYASILDMLVKLSGTKSKLHPGRVL
jgi:hypothetical protein